MKFIFIIFCITFGIACHDNTSDLKLSIKKLESQIQSIKTDQMISDLAINHLKDLDKTSVSSGALATGYVALEPMTVAPLFFAVDKVEPYLDGFKITAKIGNTTTANFRGINLRVIWASGARAESFDIPTAIQPGQWNVINFVLSKSSADDVKNFSVAINTDTVGFNRF